MAKYRFYNISLLQQNIKSSEGEVGVEGYQDLFRMYKHVVDEANTKRNLAPLAFPLRNEMYLAFLSIHIKDSYAFGTMVKYDQPDSITDLYSGTPIAKVERGGSAHRYLFNFIFNFHNHVFAIENKDNRLPDTAPFKKALEFSLLDIATKSFPSHVLEIGQITSAQAVEDAYRAATKFKNGEVTVTFTNSTLYEDSVLHEIEAELKANGIEKTTMTESASPKGFMKDFTKRFKALLGLAQTTTGEGRFRYLDKNTNKLKIFNMKAYPYETSINKVENESDEDFHKRIIRATETAVHQGTTTL